MSIALRELAARIRQANGLLKLQISIEASDHIDQMLSALEAAQRDARTISQADVSKAARFICVRSAKEMGIDGDDNWKLHGSEYIEAVTDMLKHIGFAIEAAKEG